jgi:hypothetical protein
METTARAFVIVLFDLFGAPLLCPCKHTDREHAHRVMRLSVAEGFSKGHRAAVTAGRVFPVPSSATWREITDFAGAQRPGLNGAIAWSSWKASRDAALAVDDVVVLRMPRHRSLDGLRARVVGRFGKDFNVKPFGGRRMITVTRAMCERVEL